MPFILLTFHWDVLVKVLFLHIAKIGKLFERSSRPITKPQKMPD